MVLSRPFKEDRRALTLSTPLSCRRSMVAWLCARRYCLKLLNTLDLRRRKPLAKVALPASLSARSPPGPDPSLSTTEVFHGGLQTSGSLQNMLQMFQRFYISKCSKGFTYPNVPKVLHIQMLQRFYTSKRKKRLLFLSFFLSSLMFFVYGYSE